jgi:type IV pilus assembly protein PilA
MAGYPPPPQGTPYPPGFGPPGGGPPGFGPPPGGGGGPPGYGGMVPGAPKKGMPTWLIVLIVVGGLLVLCGFIMVPLAIFGVRKYIANAKSAEARASLTQISADAVAAFERDTTVSHGETVHRMCASASASVPVNIAAVKGKKYLSTSSEWQADSARNAGFSCLKFSMSSPQYFLYRYSAHGSTKAGDSFVAEADGDLSGDGTMTTFRTTGKINDARTLEITSVPKEP